jgi:hypothetical protein
MYATIVEMMFNMGYLVGEKEVNLKVGANEKDLECHISDIMPNPEEFASLGVKEITFNGLGNASASSTDQDWETYRMQLRFTIHHDVFLTAAAIQQVVGAIYENGANASYTPDVDDTDDAEAYPHTFIYPYNTHIVNTEYIATEQEEEECYADIYTPCPPRYPAGSGSGYGHYNCSPAFAMCDGEYLLAARAHADADAEVDVSYECERCGRTVNHSIDNPTVCKRCF